MDVGKAVNSGEAPVKAEFLLPVRTHREVELDHVSAEDKVDIQNLTCDKDDDQASVNSDNGDKSDSKRKKFKLKGQNKRRKFNKKEKINFAKKPCLKFVSSLGNNMEPCPYGDRCKYGHNLDEYLSQNGEYIGNECYNYNQKGYCSFGILCRYAPSHLSTSDGKSNIVDENRWLKWKNYPSTSNHISKDVTLSLRRKNYNFDKSLTILKAIPKGSFIGPIIYDDEKLPRKSVNFKHQLYLAPLTTIGNLPFRRVCKEFGADITCGEMAMATNLLEGQQSEWALLRRHQSESIFGIQLCGSNAETMTKATQLVMENCDVDFIDINMGCPIDCVYQKGMGSGLMNKINRLNQILYGMTKVSNVSFAIFLKKTFMQSSGT